MDIRIHITPRSAWLLVVTLLAGVSLPYAAGRYITHLAPIARAEMTTPLSWVNVKDFGANGDDALDDTAAIQAAVNSLGSGADSGGGGVVYIPRGVYTISSSLTVVTGAGLPKSNFSFEGDGPGATVLKATSALSDNAVIRFDGTLTNSIRFSTVRRMTIDISQTTSGRGIDLIIAHYATIEHVRVFGPVGVNTAEGVRLDAGPDPQIHYSAYNRITGSYFQRLNIGIHLKNQVTATSISDNHITGGFQPGQIGIKTTRLCAGIAVMANEIEAWDIGIQNSGSGLMAIGNRMESNATAHIKFVQEPPSGTTMYSMTLGNANWGPSPMVLTPHSPNDYYDAISTFDVNSDFSIPNKQVSAYGFTANGREGQTVIKNMQSRDGPCTMYFSGGLLVGGTC
jgi:pectate lyase-like protein